MLVEFVLGRMELKRYQVSCRSLWMNKVLQKFENLNFRNQIFFEIQLMIIFTKISDCEMSRFANRNLNTIHIYQKH